MPELQRDDVILQSLLSDDPWKLLVGCILLNLTTRRQVNSVIWEMFGAYPDADHMAVAERRELAKMLVSLGLYNRRAVILRKFSQDWVYVENTYIEEWPPPEEIVANCYGIGPYALDSYRFFILGDTSKFESGDKVLAKWLESR